MKTWFHIFIPAFHIIIIFFVFNDATFTSVFKAKHLKPLSLWILNPIYKVKQLPGPNYSFHKIPVKKLEFV